MRSDPGPGMPEAMLYLPVTHASASTWHAGYVDLRKWLRTIGHLWHAATVSFTVAADRGQLACGYQVAGADEGSARACADDLRLTLLAVAPWVGLGDATRERPWPAPGPLASWFTCVPSGEPDIVVAGASTWKAALADAGTWHLRLSMLSLVAIPSPPAPGDDGIDRAGSAPAPAGAQAAERLPVVLELFGDGPRQAAMAALVAEDVQGRNRLVPIPATGSCVSQPALVTPELVAHLLAVPARLTGHLPAFAPSAPGRIHEQLAAAANAHRLVLGASGQGKTSLLAHLGDRAMADGATVVAVDTHDGALVRTLAQRALEHGQEPLVLQLIEPGPAPEGQQRPVPFPAIDVLQPPAGISLDSWADSLFTMIRSIVHAAEPREHFGKVGDRAGRALIRALVLDPARQATLADLPALLDPADPALAELLSRIGDPALERLLQREVIPMVTGKDPGNAAIWLASILEPLIGHPATARILGTRAHAAPLDQAFLDGHHVLVHAPATLLGQSGAALASASVIFRASAMARRQPPASGAVFIADEFSHHPGALYEREIAESRKYNVGYVLATQNLRQLTGHLRDTLLANAGAVIAFRTSPQDAAELDLLYPTITRFRMQTLPRHHVAVTTFEADAILRTPDPLPVPPRVPSWQPDTTIPDTTAPDTTAPDTTAPNATPPPRRRAALLDEQHRLILDLIARRATSSRPAPTADTRQ